MSISQWFGDFDYLKRTKEKQAEAQKRAEAAEREQKEMERWMEEAASMKAYPPVLTSGSTISSPATGVSFYSPYSAAVLGVELDAIMETKRLFMVLGLEFTVENVQYLTKEIENL